MTFVLDPSIALRWHFRDEANDASKALLVRTVRETAYVPRHWFAEVANAIVVGERRGRANNEQSEIFLRRLAQLQLGVDELGGFELIRRILPIARARRLTVYDATYLELAQRLTLPLATFDANLARAARDVGVDVLGG